LTIVVVLFGAACGGGPPHERIDPELERLLERTHELAERVRVFDHDRVLAEIGVDPENGVLCRFDERLGEVRHRVIGEAGDERRSTTTRVSLDDLELGADGIMDSPLDLPLRDFSAVELRVVSASRHRLEIELRSEKPSEAVTIDLDTVGDGAVHTYRLAIDRVVSSWVGKRLAGLRLRLPDRPGEHFEIQDVALLSNTSAFGHAAYGVTHRREGPETRRSIFQWSSSVLGFPVSLEQSAGAELDLGVSVLLGDRPVEIEVALLHAGAERRLWSTTVSSGAGWTDRRVSLDRVPTGGSVIELRVASEDPNVVFWSNPAVVVPPQRRFNIIMVLEDALRADHLSCYGHDRQTTQVKDAFAERGVRFARCFAQATKTRFSCPSFMTSLYPTATGVEGIWHPHPSLAESYITVAEVLRRRGFVTASLHQNPNAGSPAGLHQGFSYLFENLPGRAENIYTGLPLRFIEKHRERNLFLYLHLADPHEPYDPPEAFRGWFERLAVEPGAPVDRSDPRWMLEARRALYDGEIAANDRWFGVFLEKLERLGLAEDTLVIFMSDHGEHLGEHGLWSHTPPGYVQVLHTPLIMVYPRRLPGGVVVEALVQNLDIMPTILELAGIDSGGLLMQGDSLLPLVLEESEGGWSRDLAYSEEALLKKSREDPRPYGSIISDRWHVLDSLYAPMKVFDLSLDPTEVDPQRATRRLSNRIQSWLRDQQLAELEIWRGITGGEDETVALDPETIDRLRALGYLE
jgi:arylsulfatase A-like enzyme